MGSFFEQPPEEQLEEWILVSSVDDPKLPYITRRFTNDNNFLEVRMDRATDNVISMTKMDKNDQVVGFENFQELSPDLPSVEMLRIKNAIEEMGDEEYGESKDN